MFEILRPFLHFLKKRWHIQRMWRQISSWTEVFCILSIKYVDLSLLIMLLLSLKGLTGTNPGLFRLLFSVCYPLPRFKCPPCTFHPVFSISKTYWEKVGIDLHSRRFGICLISLKLNRVARLQHRRRRPNASERAAAHMSSSCHLSLNKQM